MCHFVSWVDVDGSLFYITDDEVGTERFQKLVKYFHCSDEDAIGHGFLREYFNLENKGIDQEVVIMANTSLSSIPPQIVEDIKKCKFESFVPPVPLLLTEAVEEKFWKEYKAIYKQYNEDKQKFDSDLAKTYRKIYAARRKKVKALTDRFEQKEIDYKSFDRMKQEIEDAFGSEISTQDRMQVSTQQVMQTNKTKKIRSTFWNLFRDPKNRIPAWR